MLHERHLQIFELLAMTKPNLEPVLPIMLSDMSLDIEEDDY